MSDGLRVALDGTPLLGARTGIGWMTAGLLEALSGRADVRPSAYAITWRGRHDLAAQLPPGVPGHVAAMPARAVRAAWMRTDHPRVERWTGKVDVVHATNFVPPPARAPVVVTVHDLAFLRSPELCAPESRRLPRLLARGIARGALVHATSDAVAGEVREAFDIEPDRVVRVYQGVTPTTGGDAGRGRAIAGADRYVLALGTVEPRKNLPRLVEAFDELAATRPDVHLVVAGADGWGSAAFAEAREAARHGDRIRHLGYVGSDDARHLLAGASVLAYPSLLEGFGRPPLEAMAAGVPVVAGRAGAVPEVVGDAALLADPDDAGELAAQLARVLDDPDLRARLVADGTARVGAFTWERAVDGFVALYRLAAGTTH